MQRESFGSAVACCNVNMAKIFASTGCLVLAASFAHAQCQIRARANAYSSTATVGYNDVQDSGFLASTFAPVVRTAAGSIGDGGGCSGSSSVTTTARFGSASIVGSGSATNCLTAAPTIYTMATPGATALDRVAISSSTLPVGTRVPMRVRYTLSGGCTSVQAASPFCGINVRITLSGPFGTAFLDRSASGVYVSDINIATVGSTMQLDSEFTAFAGASTSVLQNVGGPQRSVSCSINASMSFTVEPLLPGVVMTACSGHNYAPLPACDSVDFNADGVFPDDADVIDFIAVLGGASCPTCNDVDFNNDGVFPDDSDVAAFLRVLGGGAC